MMGNVTETDSGVHILSLEEKLQQLSGSLMVASLVEVIAGGCGLVRTLLRYVGPLTVAPTIALIGLSLYKVPVIYAKFNPTVTLGSAVLVVIFALYLSRLKLPLPSCKKGGPRMRIPVFQLLPILLALVVMWIIMSIVTVTGLLPDDVHHPFYYSRVDAKLNIVSQTPWFQIIYPGQFGVPSFSVAATIGFAAAVISSLVESVGDYFAAAKACQVMPPPDHAISRGILIEGLGSILSGAVGAAHATTSYSGNIATLSLSKTASRSVLVFAGIILIVFSLVGKIGAALATLPTPILGGVLLVVFGMLAALGMSTLVYVDMSSSRNLLIVGTAFLAGFAIPSFVEEHRQMLSTGNDSADQMIQVVLGIPMFVGGLVAFILDNTVQGSDQERGFVAWRQSHHSSGTKERVIVLEKTHNDWNETQRVKTLTADDIYSFSYLTGRLPSSVFKYVPFLPPSTLKTNSTRNEL